jgi:hypothetical protein
MEQTSFALIESTDLRWIDFINSSSEANIFHHPRWIGLLARCYGYRPFVAVVLDENGQVRAGLPLLETSILRQKRRWVSLPFTDYCTPLYSSMDALNQLETHLTEETCKQKIAELELRWDYQSPNLFRLSEYVHTTIELHSDPADVQKNIKKSDFHNIIAAAKKGVRVEKGADLAHLEAFYKLHIETRRRHGVPVQPWHYFKMLREELIEPGYGFISLAYKDDKCIAGGLLLHWNKTLIYKYAASNDLGRHLYANDTIVWDAICWGCYNGYSTFDWGRSDASNEGLRRFKNRWGSSECPLYYSRNHETHNGGLGEKLAPIITSVINKSPLWVCRLSGEFFYRYFG